MICPHCHQVIADGLEVCPHCDTRLDDAGSYHHEFVYCEGCGARLSSHDRTCPKCGRPAPGILSTEASASDLAAGKTASFPKLTESDIAERIQKPTAADVLAGTLDPDATTSLQIPVEELGGSRRGKRAEEDPYHRARRPWGKVIAAAAVVAALAGGAYFVAADPLGVMPGLYASIDQAASEMFPSRWASTDDDAASQDDAADSSEEPAPVEDDSLLADDEAYDTLLAFYEEIGAYQEPLGVAVDDYNGGFVASSLARRQSASAGAYALRDQVQATIDELNAIQLAEDSVYTEDLDHLKSLATWMYNRVNVLCESWDLSLAYPDGASLSQHQSEISQPLRDALDAQGRNADLVQFEENYAAWRPTQK